MGEVYRATGTRLDRTVAIQTLTEDFAKICRPYGSARRTGAVQVGGFQGFDCCKLGVITAWAASSFDGHILESSQVKKSYSALRLQKLQESVIRSINRYGLEKQAVSLAQGFPDFEPPAEIITAAQNAMKSGLNQEVRARKDNFTLSYENRKPFRERIPGRLFLLVPWRNGLSRCPVTAETAGSSPAGIARPFGHGCALRVWFMVHGSWLRVGHSYPDMKQALKNNIRFWFK